MEQFDAHEAAQKVHDVDSFLRFLETLFEDWQAARALNESKPSSPYGSMYGWENTNIGDFLEAAVAGAKDNRLGKSGGTYADENAWQQAAQIILLGKVYE